MKASDHALPKPLAVFQQMFRILTRALFLAILTGGIPSSQAGTERDAQRHFQEKRYESALKIYRRLARENPDMPRFAYNAGASAYRAKDMEEAEKQFVNASHSPENLKLQQKAHYNLGNTLFRLGEAAANPEQKIANWEQAIQRYQHAISLDETDQDAQENLDFVKHRLEELQQQQQNQEQQPTGENENQESSEQEQPDISNAETNPENSTEQNNEPQSSSESAANREREQDEENQTQQSQPNTESTTPETPLPSEPQSNDKEEKPSSGTASPSPGKMTPEQARQLLDAERNQAKAMIFQPPQKPQPRNSSFKDW